MKAKFVFILICVFFLFNIKGQDSLKRTSIGIDFSIGNNALGRENILPSITLSKGNHLAFVGPAFIYNMPYNPYPPQYGVQAGYQFYPNGTMNRFNLFFEYDFNYVNANFIRKFNGSYPESVVRKDISILSIDNYLGFGFRLKIFKGLYFKSNIGIGAIYYLESVSETHNNGEVYQYEYKYPFVVGKINPFNSMYSSYYTPFYQNEYKRFVGLFKVGLGCDLYSFKNKK